MPPSSPLDISIAPSKNELATAGTCTVVYASSDVVDVKSLELSDELSLRAIEDPLSPFIGPAVVLEIEHNPIRAVDLKPIVLAILARGEGYLPPRLLFKTSKSNLSGENNYAILEVDAIEYLYMQGVRLIGIDSPSIDRPGKSDITTLMRVNHMHWLVNLDLSQVSSDKLYLLFCAPCDLNNVGSVPCRALVVPL